MRKWFLLAVLLGVSGSVFAFQITSDVNTDEVSLGQAVYFTVVLEGSMDAEPVPPDFSGFYLRGKSIATKLSMGTGKKSIFVKEYMYTLFPEKEGELTIGPAVAEIDGKKIETKPIKITVKKGLSHSAAGKIQARPSDEVGVEVSENNKHVFVHEYLTKQTAFAGEQIVLVTKLYYDGKINIDNLRRIPQSSPGFISEIFTDRIQYDEKIGDTVYRVSEIRTAYFPMDTGLQFIQGPKFEFNVYRMKKWIGIEVEKSVLGGKRNKVEIKPLPEEGKPPDFMGQVGSYGVFSSLSKNSASEGEPITFKFAVTGNGSVAGIKAPFSKLEGFNVAGIETEITDIAAGNMLERQKIFNYIVIPRKAGELIIPAVEFNYFDPAENAYKTVSSGRLELTVEEGKDTGPIHLVTIREGEGALSGEKIVKGKADLPVYRKNVKDEDKAVIAGINRIFVFAVYFAAIAVLVSAILLSVHRERLENDEFYARRMFSGRKVKALFRQSNEFACAHREKEFSTSL
ncbi:MAG: BatD family protein, partial [bacterium]|nr:BatD family protein [bacterium]